MQTFPDRKAASQDYGLPNEEKHGGMSPKPNDGLFVAESPIQHVEADELK